MMFINRRGVLTFDGQNWNLVKIPVIPYTIKFNPEINTTFIGGENSYGYIEQDDKGFYNYFRLSDDSIKHGPVTGIYFSGSSVYFYGDYSVSRFNLEAGKNDLFIGRRGNNPFSGMIITPKNVFMNVYGEGLFRLESDTLFPIVTGYMLKDVRILFSLPYNNNLVLLGLDDGRIQLFDGIKFYDYQINDNGYLRQNILSEGIAVSDLLYAFATLDGGVLVVERNSGKVVHTINYASGLPDDEVFALGSDRNGGIWISHEFGLTRADLMLPVGNFSVYPGLKGNLTGMVIYDNQLYVSTSEGVFYLTEEKQYISEEIFVRTVTENISSGVSNIADINEIRPDTRIQPAEVPGESGKERKGLLSRIFRKKQESPAINKEPSDVVEAVVSPGSGGASNNMQPQMRTGLEKRTIRKLKSVDYVYKKVSGLDEKCRNLIPTSGGILAATNRGLVVIRNYKADYIAANKYIYSINPGNEKDTYWISASDGFFMASYKAGKWTAFFPDPAYQIPVYAISATGKDTIWLGVDNGVTMACLTEGPVYTSYIIKTDYPQRYIPDYVNDTLFLFTESGIYFLDREKNNFSSYCEFHNTGELKSGYVLSMPGEPWIEINDEWLPLNRKKAIAQADRDLLKVFDDIIAIYSDDKAIWIGNAANNIYRVRRDEIKNIYSGLTLFIKSISNDRGEYFSLDNVIFGSNDNNIYFEISSPSYVKQKSVQYQYIVDKVMSDWSKWSPASVINLMLQPGKYTLKVRARDLWGNQSEIQTVYFTIETPFTRTAFFYVLLSVIFLVFIFGLIKFRERRLRAEKRILEEKVRERTAEIEARKEEITSSIAYASRIQNAMLPSEENFSELLGDYFLVFKPRDMVSGDFYWFTADEKNLYFTVADCTGHGVPGAFMSTLGISTLNEIIANNNQLNAGEVLNLLRKKVMDALHQTGKEGEAADGMDISFCILSKDRRLLQYAGAFNPLFIVSNGHLTEYKADRMPIGIHIGGEAPFTNYTIKVKPGDLIYLFTDGISDQFGGPEGKKFKKSNFRRLITDICSLPLKEQKIILEKEYQNWKGNLNQVDDITILGLRI
ncbi:MAG: SpoIIE family protein phosphatase [Bacteroidales bacterium]|nr:SpoIIE family protein phosphatase [Bacteroidales bacterium]